MEGRAWGLRVIRVFVENHMNMGKRRRQESIAETEAETACQGTEQFWAHKIQLFNLTPRAIHWLCTFSFHLWAGFGWTQLPRTLCISTRRHLAGLITAQKEHLLCIQAVQLSLLRLSSIVSICIYYDNNQNRSSVLWNIRLKVYRSNLSP